MFSRIMSAAIRGVSIELIAVETDVSNGLPAFEMVGLLNSEVKEAKERVKTAIKNSQIELPPKKITINLSPADVKKGGSAFDLPIAVGILVAIGIITTTINIEETLLAGELGLDGRVNKVSGILAMVSAGKEHGITRFIVPQENAMEGAMIQGVEVFGVSHLTEVIFLLNQNCETMAQQVDVEELYEKEIQQTMLDFSEINGQKNLKRAAEVAAAGMHNLLLIGPPGSGKSMLAERIPSILPKPDIEEALEITKIYSIAGALDGRTLIADRPFRSPHHTITTKALVGGGMTVKAGEITLAHRGVLFLDEFAEFRQEAIQALRQPMEKKKVMISRTSGVYEFPADIMVVAATNPCKCGYYPDRRKCNCSLHEVHKYMGRIGGPILDRMDICVGVSAVEIEDIQRKRKNESSKDIRKRVEAAHFLQKERYKNKNIRYNSQLRAKELEDYCYLGEQEKQLLKTAFVKFQMSARGYYKIVRVARTIADLEGCIRIRTEHIAEALSYRTVMKE